MKKLATVFISVFMFACMTLSVDAYNFSEDLDDKFISYDSVLYLTQETKANNIRYYGDRMTITDKDSNEVDADSYLKTGDRVNYLGVLSSSNIVLVGDVDCNGKISASDARKTLRFSAGLDGVAVGIIDLSATSFSGKYVDAVKLAADADFSGKITAKDARSVLRVAANLDEFTEFAENVNRQKEASSKEVDYSTVVAILLPEYEKDFAEYAKQFESLEIVKSVGEGALLEYSDFCVVFEVSAPCEENYKKLVDIISESEAFVVF